MAKDVRYKNAKYLIDNGTVKTIKEIFDNKILPRVLVYTDMGFNNVRFDKLIEKIEEFTIKDLFRFADLLEIDEETILKLMLTQYFQKKEKSKKKK